MTRLFNSKSYQVVSRWEPGAVKFYGVDGTVHWAIEIEPASFGYKDDGKDSRENFPNLSDIPELE